MKGKLIAVLPVMMAASAVHAQSNVTLYGNLDVGIDFASNEVDGRNGQIVPGSGGKVYQEASGVPAASKWGLKGAEDLGGGLKAIFKVEGGFNAVNGVMGGNSQMWSRNAYVGIQSDRYGTVTLGKQWDSIVDMVEVFSLNGNYGGYYFAHPNDMDNMDNGFSVNNAAKYVSPKFYGFQIEGHYSFGGQAGEFSHQSTYSAAATYASGKFSASVGYLHVSDPQVAVYGYQSGGSFVNAVYGDALANARSQGIFAIGAAYQVGKLKLFGNFTNTIFEQGDAGRNVTFQNYELSAIYLLTAAITLGGGYTYTTGHDHVTGRVPKYQQLNLIAQYALSKTTEVYVMSALQRASDAAQFAQIAGFNPSSSNKQAVVRVGLMHQF